MKKMFTLICSVLMLNTGFSQSINVPDSTLSLQTRLGNKPLAKKWSFNTFQGFSAGVGIGNGMRTSFYGIQAGIQVNRLLSNNVFAFGAASIAPTYMNFNRSFINSDFSKTGYGNFRPANLGLNPRLEMGLGYTNDARTFSISGSISVQQNNYGYGNGFLPYQNLNQPFGRNPFQ